MEASQVSDDVKLDFYLKNRAQIEEWADLRSHAQDVLDEALLAAVTARPEGDVTPVPQMNEKGDPAVKLRIAGAEDEMAWVELNWSPRSLLKTGGGAWPALIVAGSPDLSFRPVRDKVKQATRPYRADLGLDQGGSGWWIWYGRLRPESEPIDVEEYAAYCAGKLRNAWIVLNPVMLAAIAAARSAGA